MGFLHPFASHVVLFFLFLSSLAFLHGAAADQEEALQTYIVQLHPRGSTGGGESASSDHDWHLAFLAKSVPSSCRRRGCSALTTPCSTASRRGSRPARRRRCGRCRASRRYWMLDEANLTMKSWKIQVLLAIEYSIHYADFFHVYYLEDFMTKPKQNALWVCLDAAPASPTNPRARQFFGAPFSRRRLAKELVKLHEPW
ncbi:hypothetical protein TRIUR3_35161 [Triticum urartu]|uniref:Uncharacterized protein n=1 Tax=Triticum urartu TaxID=4572 RepID=M7YA85_TRIUA|nr:hypothetical protein TRIUR3_35161 [Triticum urartu]